MRNRPSETCDTVGPGVRPGTRVTEPRTAARPVGSYAYGESLVAMQRLLVLAEIFAPSSRAFLERVPADHARVVLDLGCGIGETTRLLAERFPHAQTTGLDSSAAMVAVARSRAARSQSFRVADVTTMSLSAVPPELMYGRLLLAHLPDPTQRVTTWAGQLAPGGVLALEEVERIVTDGEPFHEYLQIAAEALRARGTELFIGPTLGRMNLQDDVEKTSRVCIVRPSSRIAARMFALNLRTLRRDPLITATHSERQLHAVAVALDARSRDRHGPPISWELRQIILRRRPHTGPPADPQGQMTISGDDRRGR